MITIAGYHFEGAYDTTTGLPDSAGIYVILDYHLNGNPSVLDVGESETIKTRIDNHERQPCWNRNGQGYVRFAVLYTTTWTAAQRRSVESTIRQQYQPPCGDR